MSSEIWELVRPVQEKGPKPNKTNLKMTAEYLKMVLRLENWSFFLTAIDLVDIISPPKLRCLK